jgi:hypothetical protein
MDSYDNYYARLVRRAHSQNRAAERTGSPKNWPVDNGYSVRARPQNLRMTESLRAHLQTITISSAEDLASFWRELTGGGGFGRRTLWLAVVDDAGHPTPVVAPIDDIPRAPTETDVDNLGFILDGMAKYGTVVMLLSRPGEHGVREEDRHWARTLSRLSLRWPLQLATADASGRCKIWSLS